MRSMIGNIFLVVLLLFCSVLSPVSTSADPLSGGGIYTDPFGGTGIYGGDSSVGGSGIWSPADSLPAASFDLPLTISYIPTTAEGRGTFTRATTAYVTNNDGMLTLVKSGEIRFEGARRIENLLTNSESLNNTTAPAWAIAKLKAFGSGSNINATAAPNGFTTADEITEDNTTGNHRLSKTIVSPVSVAGNKYIASAYVKRGTGTRNVCLGLVIGSGFSLHSFNLSNGTVGTGITFGGVTTASTSISDAGSGWYRVAVVINAIAGSIVYTLDTDSGTACSTSFAGDNASSLYVTGAQLEDVSSQTTQTTAGDYVPNGSLTSVTNRIRHSEEVGNGNSWTSFQSSVTSDAVANPLTGVVNADFLKETAVTNTHGTSNTAISITHEANLVTLWSIYAKANGRDYIKLDLNGSALNRGCFFDLALGAVGTCDAGFSGGITSIGSGWYRCWVYQTTANGIAGNVSIGISTDGSTTSYAGDITKGVYVYGGMISTTNSTTTPPTYVATGTSPYPAVADGVKYFSTDLSGTDIADATLKGALIEGARTNKLLYTEAFDDATSGATWVETNITVTADSAVAPNGTTTADTLTAGANNATTVQALTGTVASYTFSVYFKRKTGTGAISISADGVTFTTCTVSDTVWTRCADTRTLSVASYNQTIKIATNGDAVYAWGAQGELGAFASSYIFNLSTGAGVTRNADILTFPTAGNVLAASGTAIATAQLNQAGVQGNIIDVGNTELAMYHNSTNVLSLSDGVNTTSTGANSWNNTSRHKLATSWTGTTSGAAIDGASVVNGTFGTFTLGTNMTIGGQNGAGTNPPYGNVRSIKLWTTALTSSQMQSQTQ